MGISVVVAAGVAFLVFEQRGYQVQTDGSICDIDIFDNRFYRYRSDKNIDYYCTSGNETGILSP